MEDREYIERYLANQLTDKEQEDFLKRCAEDVDFSQRYREEAMIIQVVKDEDARIYLEKVDEILSGVTRDSGKISRLTLTTVVVAVAAVIVLLLGLFFFNPQTPSSDELFATHFETYPLVLATRGDGADGQRQLVHAYDQEHWEEVLRLLPHESLTGPLNVLYQSIAHLQLGQSVQATALLKKDRQALATSLHLNILDWYLVMAYLQSDQTGEAKSLLQDLSGRDLAKGLRKKVDDLNAAL